MASKSLSIVAAEGSSLDQRVKILELLACGGMSRVYRCMWRGSVVAQKVMILPDNPTSIEKRNKEEYRQAMEAAISASMSHPNVVQTYSYEVVPVMSCERNSSEGSQTAACGEDSSSCGSSTEVSNILMWEARIIQEYCTRGSVAQAIKDNRLHEGATPVLPITAVTLGIARDVAAGMSHIHAMHIIHGDLKAGNILLQPAPTKGGLTAKVADFGLSIKMDRHQTHVSGVAAGTVTHMAPELLQHNRNSQAADVYAYGIFLYELFTGQRAWPGLSGGQVVNEVVVKRRRPIFPPHMPVKVIALADRCWSDNPLQRPDFNEILAAVDNLIALHNKGFLVSELAVCPICCRG